MHTKKNLSVESIRGFACLMVLFSHLSLTFFPYIHAIEGKAEPQKNTIQAIIHESPFSFFFSGTSAVFIFFVLSGFILTKVALKEGNLPEKIYSMGLKRYPRLMIPALCSCLVAYVFFYAFDMKSDVLSHWINDYGSGTDYSLLGAIYSGVVDVFFISGRSSYNPVLWTMMIELFGSFAVYLLCLNRMTCKIPFLVAAIFLATLALTAFNLMSANLGLGLIAFYGGYLFSIYGRKISSRLSVFMLLIGGYLAGAHNTSDSYGFIYNVLGAKTSIICNFLSGFFIVYAVLYNDKLNVMLSGKVPVFLGKVSFSVYLIHLPILSTLGVFLFNELLSLCGDYNLSAIVASLITILSIYLLSFLFYKTVDSKSMVISEYFSRAIINQFNTFYRSFQKGKILLRR